MNVLQLKVAIKMKNKRNEKNIVGFWENININYIKNNKPSPDLRALCRTDRTYKYDESGKSIWLPHHLQPQLAIVYCI